MTKQETQVLKGWAICSMLYMHLFDNAERVASECTYFLSLGEIPLVTVLARMMNPVPYFMILSGYGMFMVNQRPGGDINRKRRLIKILLHYWLILLCFVVVGGCIGLLKWPKFNEILLNLLTWDVTLCPVNWFLFPYLILAFFSKNIVTLFNKCRCRYLLIATFALNFITSFLISRVGDSFLFNNLWCYNPMLCFHLLFGFTLGYCAARCNWFRRIKIGHLLAFLLLVVLCVLRCLVDTSIVHNEFAFLFIILFLNIVRLKPIDKLLGFLGGHSMNIWFIHAWFYWLLFHNFIYGFRYPALIYIVLLTVSTLCSYFTNIFLSPLEKRL